MSDFDDDNFMMEDDEEYDFEYEEDQAEEPDVDLENNYYLAKGKKGDDPAAAIKEFKKLLESETEKGEWGFKSLKQLVKLSVQAGDYANTLEYYHQLLLYTKNAVTRNYSEKSINNILDYVSSCADMNFLEKFYDKTLKSLEEAKNERLWTKTNLKVAKLWLDRKEYGRLTKILRQLHALCKREDGTDDPRKGTQLLEIYALEIQMYTETKNNKKLKALYNQCIHIKSAIPHPRIMGVIRECGGKMHMSEKEWDKAQQDFFESFHNYDEAGSPQRIQVLKYLVLANMLMSSQINPFDSQETKPYKNDPQILAMTNLVNAYQRHEIREVEKILRENHSAIMGDSFIRQHIDDLLRNIRTTVLLALITPYTRITLPFIAKELNISGEEVEELLVSLILDGKVKGVIDQVHERLDLHHSHQNGIKEDELKLLANNIGHLQKACSSKLV